MNINKMPVEIETRKITSMEATQNAFTEIVFVLHGEVALIMEGMTYSLNTEDIVLINPNQLHSFISGGCHLLIVRFDLSDFNFGTSTEYFFELNSAGNTYLPKYNFSRYLLAQLVKAHALGENRFHITGLTCELISHLIERFRIVAPEKVSPTRKNRQRASEIMKYINENYSRSLSLADIADHFCFSIQYLSSFFEKNVGMTIMSYYNNVRLNHMIAEMLSTDESLENLALANGFRNVRAFSAIFKKAYNCLPSDYRKSHREKLEDSSGMAEELLNSAELGSLAKYLSLHTEEKATPFSPADTLLFDAGTIDCSAQGTPLLNNCFNMCCVGSAKQFLYAEIRDMVRLVQQEIHYKYVKFHGILSDETMVYTEDEDGNPVYSFSIIDKILDFILSVDLKPLLQLSFMPTALASDRNKNIDMGHFNTSPPKDIEKWCALIERTIRHIEHRYGASEVQSWLFCVWNEPDSTSDLFGWNDTAEFFEFYKRTLQSVKKIDPKLKFGTPSLLIAPNEEESWAGHFLRYCASNDCLPDFINIHYYDNDFTNQSDSEGLSLSNISILKPINSNPFAFTEFINSLKQTCRVNNMSSLPIYLTEWNLTISHRDPINDTCFKSCYLTKNLLENYDRLESYGYWCITDFIEELQLPNELFHGGLGMFTYNGIPKAHFNTFKFLRKLGDEKLASGKGYFVTRGQNRIVIMLYNYEHYTKFLASGNLFDIKTENRYSQFTQMNAATFRIVLDNLPYSRCLIKERFVNQSRGSSYDAWVRMGAQPLTSTEDLDILRQESRPGMHLHRAEITDGTLELAIKLDPLEVRLVEVELN